MAEKSSIGFVGIGEMGSRMATRLVDAGHPVAVFDSDRAKQDAFARRHQCRAPATLAELGRDADFVVTMLPDGHVVRHVYLEAEEGALARSLKPGCVAIDTSSSDPVGTRQLAASLAERGVALVDAPVSGGITGAETGGLVFMVGGNDKAAIARARAVLDLMGRRIFELGGAGNGHAMKCLNNFVSGTGFLAALEATVIGSHFGLDPNQMMDVMNESTGRNHATANTIKQEMVSRSFATRFVLGLMAKDVKIAADLAEDIGVNAPLSRESRDLFARAREVVGGAADHTEAVKYWEKLNPSAIGHKAGK